MKEMHMEPLLGLLSSAGVIAGLTALLLAVPRALVNQLVVRLWTAQLRRNGVSEADIAAFTLASAMRGITPAKARKK